MATTDSSATAHPFTRAGDPFYAAGEAKHRPDPGYETPHGCISGVVYIGHMVEDEDTGEEVEVYEAVPCRRCGA
jgi:hypothetical protein